MSANVQFTGSVDRDLLQSGGDPAHPPTRPTVHRPQVGEEGASRVGYNPVTRHTPAPDQIKNPFLDD